MYIFCHSNTEWRVRDEKRTLRKSSYYIHTALNLLHSP